MLTVLCHKLKRRCFTLDIVHRVGIGGINRLYIRENLFYLRDKLGMRHLRSRDILSQIRNIEPVHRTAQSAVRYEMLLHHLLLEIVVHIKAVIGKNLFGGIELRLHARNLEVRLDLQNRASRKNTRFLAENYTILLGAGLNIGEKWIIFAKGGFDHNSDDIIDLYNPLGGDVHFESAGFEFYPMSSRNLRLHFCGTHTNTDGTHNYQANIGLTWKVNLLNIKKNNQQ